MLSWDQGRTGGVQNALEVERHLGPGVEAIPAAEEVAPLVPGRTKACRCVCEHEFPLCPLVREVAQAQERLAAGEALVEDLPLEPQPVPR